MITLNDFSFLMVTQVNDLNRVHGVYNSIRSLYSESEIVIVYDNKPGVSLNVQDNNLLEISTDKRVYVSGGYNLALKNSTRKCFVFIHDDTYIAKNFLENIIPHITENQFCNFTTVEPPLYNDPDSVTKPIKDFGRDSKTFNIENFNQFCKNHIANLKTMVIESPFGGFFMSGYKSSIDSVGGFDEYFKPYFYEDADLMIRLHQAGYRFVQVLNSLVYHMGSLTSRANQEGVDAHNITANLFLKKWKVPFECIKQYTMLGGISYKKIPFKIEAENLQGSLKSFIDLISDDESDIIVSFDQNKLTNEDFNYIQTLPYLLQSIDGAGSYELGQLKIKCRK